MNAAFERWRKELESCLPCEPLPAPESESESDHEDSESDHEDEPHITKALKLLAREICRIDARLPLRTTNCGKAIWCMRELMKFTQLDLATIFDDDTF